MAEYRIEFDQGGNVGLKCPECGQIRWKADHETKDWATGKDCSTCQKLKAEEVWAGVNLEMDKQKKEIKQNKNAVLVKKLKEWEKANPAPTSAKQKKIWEGDRVVEEERIFFRELRKLEQNRTV